MLSSVAAAVFPGRSVRSRSQANTAPLGTATTMVTSANHRVVPSTS